MRTCCKHTQIPRTRGAQYFPPSHHTPSAFCFIGFCSSLHSPHAVEDICTRVSEQCAAGRRDGTSAADTKGTSWSWGTAGASLGPVRGHSQGRKEGLWPEGPGCAVAFGKEVRVNERINHRRVPLTRCRHQCPVVSIRVCFKYRCMWKMAAAPWAGPHVLKGRSPECSFIY